MLDSLLVTFREGLESFLIIGVITAYLRKTDRAKLIGAVKIGLGLSVVTCALGAWLWLQVPNQPLYEGMFALVAALFVGGLLLQTLRAGRKIKAHIEARVGKMVGEAGQAISARAVAGVALATTLLVTREGLEALFYLRVKAFYVKAPVLVVGGVLGLVLAGVVSWTWTRFANKLNLGVVLKVTALFLGVFLFQLLVYGVHELAESGVLEGSQAFHDATEVLGPDGRIGHFISYSLLGAPLLYLFWARRAKPPRQQPPAAA